MAIPRAEQPRDFNVTLASTDREWLAKFRTFLNARKIVLSYGTEAGGSGTTDFHLLSDPDKAIRQSIKEWNESKP